MRDGWGADPHARAVSLADLRRGHVARPSDKPRDHVRNRHEAMASEDRKRGRVEVRVAIVEREDHWVARYTPISVEIRVQILGCDRVVTVLHDPIHLVREIAR